MAGAVNQAHNEFWRPPAAAAEGGQEHYPTCQECHSEFIVGSRYCHRCGATRPDTSMTSAAEIPGVAELQSLGKRLGLALPALVAFLFGAFCLLGAISIGVFFTARTALDWQAIQLWRIEWLLGATAAFAAGCLLKKSV